MLSIVLATALVLIPSAQAPVSKTPAAPAGQLTAATQAPKRTDVYDEKAVGAEQVAAALAKAKFAHKRVLIQWGANWCGWCIKLHDLYRKDKDIAHELLYEYELVRIDIGKWDKHLDLAAQYQADFKKHGVPYLTVLDEDGKLVINQDSNPLELPADPSGAHDTGGIGHDAAKVLAFLKENQAPRTEADAVFSAAVARAKKEGKSVFVHFSTPWCGWCRKLEGWMAQKDIAPIFDQSYVDVMIDAERYNGGASMLTHYAGDKTDGPGYPWIVIVDANGTKLADSYYAGDKNIGFPSDEAEIAHFLDMLSASSKRMDPAVLEKVRLSLVSDREQREKAQREAKDKLQREAREKAEPAAEKPTPGL